MRHPLVLFVLAGLLACSGPSPRAEAPPAGHQRPVPVVQGEQPPPQGHSVHAEHERERLGAPDPASCPHHAGGQGAADSGHGHRVDSAQHRFDDPQKWAKVFESPERDAWQKPDAVIERLGLERDASVADVGAGTGYFAVRLARYLRMGVVYAVDIEPKMVEHLQGRAQRERLPNLVPVLGAPDDPRIPSPVDLVLLVDTWHHVADRPAYLQRLQRQLKPGGRIAIVDFTMGDIPVGPPKHHRVAPDVIQREFADAGYRLAKRDDKLLPYQHLLIFELAPSPGRPPKP